MTTNLRDRLGGQEAEASRGVLGKEELPPPDVQLICKRNSDPHLDLVQEQVLLATRQTVR